MIKLLHYKMCAHHDFYLEKYLPVKREEIHKFKKKISTSFFYLFSRIKTNTVDYLLLSTDLLRKSILH